jgi:hypothetical protein
MPTKKKRIATAPADVRVLVDEGKPPNPFTELPLPTGGRFRVTLAEEGKAVRFQLRADSGTLRQGPQVPVDVAERIAEMLSALREHGDAA